MSPIRLIQRTAGEIAHLLVPRVCLGCNISLASESPDLCVNCGWELSGLVGGDFCRACGQEIGQFLLVDGHCSDCRTGKNESRFKQFIRVGRYGGVLRRLVLRYKQEFILDHFLGTLLSTAIAANMDTKDVDYWVPVPSHWLRTWKRGFQPTALLARSAARPWRGRVAPLLYSTRLVRPFHHGMSASDREQAIGGAFAVAPGANLRGKRVMLIDDVSTTGTTLGEAKRTLYHAGCRWIGAAVLAKTSNLPDITQGVDPFRHGP